MVRPGSRAVVSAEPELQYKAMYFHKIIKSFVLGCNKPIMKVDASQIYHVITVFIVTGQSELARFDLIPTFCYEFPRFDFVSVLILRKCSRCRVIAVKAVPLQ